MLEKILKDYFPECDKELLSLLADPRFEEFIHRNRLNNGKHCIKIKHGGRVVARSVEFDIESARNKVKNDLVDVIYVEIHGKNQRSFDFPGS